MTRCPICDGTPRALLSLENQPVYQHPVPSEAQVPGPYTVDLCWVRCETCAHAWQPDFDPVLLERIYKSHYYTPAPGGLARQFRDDFISTMDEFGLTVSRASLLEIGASDGDVLAALKERTGAPHAHAFEPNIENAAIARSRGLIVYESFFGRSAVERGTHRSGLVYARHVIEHIFDFVDFFEGINASADHGADLILETPSLDYHGTAGSLLPFHIEHVHVFSLRSLAVLASRFGWMLHRSTVTRDGNLIAAFRCGALQSSMGFVAPNLDGLQAATDAYRARLRRLVEARSLVFWGAGSAGIGLARIIGREPDFWTDGNPNKVGKKFPGLESRIMGPDEAFAAARQGSATLPLLIITSSFVREILPKVQELGWAGEVVDLNGAQLQPPSSAPIH